MDASKEQEGARPGKGEAAGGSGAGRPNWAAALHLKTRQGPYGIQSLTRTLGLSRTTLLYYESLGIVSSARAGEGGMREFSAQDIFKLVGAMTLKNVGVPPKDLAARLADDPFSPGHFDAYAACVERRIRYAQAQLAALDALSRLRGRVGRVDVEDVPAHLIYFDQAEQGFHRYPEDQALDALLENAPICSLGAVYEGDFLRGAYKARAGRTVPASAAGLIDGLPEGLPVLGGCRCVCCAAHVADPFGSQDGAAMDETAGRMAEFADERGLTACGDAFNPYTLCCEDGLYMLVCQPVEERG